MPLFMPSPSEQRTVSDYVEDGLLDALFTLLWRDKDDMKTAPDPYKRFVAHLAVKSLWKGFEMKGGGIDVPLAEDTFLHALSYLRRLPSKEIRENRQSSDLDGARLLMTTCSILADKILNDEPLSLSAWASVSGLPVKDLTSTEAMLASALDYRLPLDSSYVEEMRRELGLRKMSTTQSNTPAKRSRVELSNGWG